MILNISEDNETPSNATHKTGATETKSANVSTSTNDGFGFLNCNRDIGSVEPGLSCFNVAGIGKISLRWQHLVYKISKGTLTCCGGKISSFSSSSAS